MRKAPLALTVERTLLLATAWPATWYTCHTAVRKVPHIDKALAPPPEGK